MEGLDIDAEQDEMTLSRALQIIHEQNERIRALSDVEERLKRLQMEYDRLQSESSFPKPNQESRTDATVMEVRKLKEALAEKEHRLQYSEEVNNRLVFRMRSHQTEMSGKENEIKELKQEISFLKRNTSKPIEILVSEIKQKDMVIESYKRKMREDRTSSIRISDIEPERFSFSYGQIPSNLSSSYSTYQNSYRAGVPRFSRPNRVSVQDETDIINDWNRVVQIFSDRETPEFSNRLKQYVILNISRLAMLNKNVDSEEEGIFSQQCSLCCQSFNCIHKPIVCSFCGYMYCKHCAPRSLPLGENNEMKKLCVLCEAMYRFVYKKDSS